jgi:tetratricopeptide (TPR) repeat protein
VSAEPARNREWWYTLHVRNLVSKSVCALIVCVPWAGLIAQNAPDVRQKIGALEQQAQKYLQEQKPQLTIPILREIVSLDPKNLNAQANLGVLLFFQGEHAEAIPHMRAALELQPQLWRIQALLGIAEKRTGDAARAQIDLEKAFSNLDDTKIQLEAGLELLELRAASGQLDKALSVASKLADLAPKNPQILFATFHIARRLMDQSLLSMMIAAPDSPEMHMMMAGELGRQGNQTNAIAQYREAIRLNPKLPGAHFELAEQLRTAADPALNAQAEAEYRASIRVNQYDEKAWRELGRIMMAKGDFKAAEENYRKAVALEPKDSEAKTGLATVLISLDRTNDAISLLESAVQDDPTNTAAHYRLGMLYRSANRTADADREMEAFHRYQDVREKLDKIFRQLVGVVRENPEGPRL